MAYITVKEEINAYELKERLWSGAEDVMQRIIDEDKEETFFAILSDLHCDEDGIDLTEINDLLRFESEQVYEWCGIREEDKEYFISDEEYEELKKNGVLSETNLNIIKDNLDVNCHSILTSEFDDLTEDEIEELDRVVV